MYSRSGALESERCHSKCSVVWLPSFASDPSIPLTFCVQRIILVGHMWNISSVAFKDGYTRGNQRHCLSLRKLTVCQGGGPFSQRGSYRVCLIRSKAPSRHSCFSTSSMCETPSSRRGLRRVGGWSISPTMDALNLLPELEGRDKEIGGLAQYMLGILLRLI